MREYKVQATTIFLIQHTGITESPNVCVAPTPKRAKIDITRFFCYTLKKK